MADLALVVRIPMMPKGVEHRGKAAVAQRLSASVNKAPVTYFARFNS